jgi:hypothetical protein
MAALRREPAGMSGEGKDSDGPDGMRRDFDDVQPGDEKDSDVPSPREVYEWEMNDATNLVTGLIQAKFDVAQDADPLTVFTAQISNMTTSDPNAQRDLKDFKELVRAANKRNFKWIKENCEKMFIGEGSVLRRQCLDLGNRSYWDQIRETGLRLVSRLEDGELKTWLTNLLTKSIRYINPMVERQYVRSYTILPPSRLIDVYDNLLNPELSQRVVRLLVNLSTFVTDPMFDHLVSIINQVYPAMDNSYESQLRSLAKKFATLESNAIQLQPSEAGPPVEAADEKTPVDAADEKRPVDAADEKTTVDVVPNRPKYNAILINAIAENYSELQHLKQIYEHLPDSPPSASFADGIRVLSSAVAESSGRKLISLLEKLTQREILEQSKDYLHKLNRIIELINAKYPDAKRRKASPDEADQEASPESLYAMIRKDRELVNLLTIVSNQQMLQFLDKINGIIEEVIGADPPSPVDVGGALATLGAQFGSMQSDAPAPHYLTPGDERKKPDELPASLRQRSMELPQRFRLKSNGKYLCVVEHRGWVLSSYKIGLVDKPVPDFDEGQRVEDPRQFGLKPSDAVYFYTVWHTDGRRPVVTAAPGMIGIFNIYINDHDVTEGSANVRTTVWIEHASASASDRVRLKVNDNDYVHIQRPLDESNLTLDKRATPFEWEVEDVQAIGGFEKNNLISPFGGVSLVNVMLIAVCVCLILLILVLLHSTCTEQDARPPGCACC